MIERRLIQLVRDRLLQFPAVAILGPRQVGKTTLARRIAETQPRPRGVNTLPVNVAARSLYLDLEKPADLAKLADPAQFLAAYENELVILDEVQRLPGLFNTLRSLIDEGRRRGRKSGRFLLLGSASIDLLKQSGESLAGRIAYLELQPLDVLEIEARDIERLWLRGGFPDSFLAEDDRRSGRWRENFVRTYLERDIPQLGPRIPAETLRRFWTMLAHQQGGLLNAAEMARSLAIEGKSIMRYVDIFTDLLLVRRLTPLHANGGKRLIKSPKLYIRDSGLTHSLLNLPSREAVFGHPIVGASWEGFAIENIVSVAPEGAQANFYRTSNGAEIDLVLSLSGGERWAIEIKLGLAPKVAKGFHLAREDLKPTQSFVAYSGDERYGLGDGVEAIGLREICEMLASRAV